MISLLQVQKFRGKTGDNMADKNYLHTAYANSADGTDGFTTVYPNLNLFTGTSDKPSTSTGGSWNVAVIGVYKIPKVGQAYTISVEVPEADHDVVLEGRGLNNAGGRASDIFFKRIKSGEKAYITFTWPDPKGSGATQFAANLAWTNDTDAGAYSYCKAKLEPGSTATTYMPSASEVTTADWPKYVGTYVDTNPVSSTVSSKYDWDEMKYRVYLDGVPVGGSKLLSFNLENLKADTTYNVQINQINGNIESDKSESVAFKTTLTQ